jgi:methylmalonyl-CoA carboxyltransferase small subunit
VKLQIAVRGATYEVEVEVSEEQRLVRKMGASGTPAVMAHSDPPCTSAAGAGAGVRNRESTLCLSPIAGVVTQVVVQPGSQVQQNDVLFVLEAMKMETRITAALPGKIKSVKVARGNAVKARQILGEFE